MRIALVTLLACTMVALILSANAAVPIEDVSITGSPTGPWRRLFLDAMVVEHQTGLERVFHAAEKYAGNPVLKVDKPWEGKGYGATVHGGTVMWDEGKLRMWYIGGHTTQGGGFRICYAESRDGLAWEKPALGIIEFLGNKENNIVLDAIMEPELEQLSYVTFVSVMKRSDEKDPNRRYALYGYYHTREKKDGRFSKFVHLRPRVAFSPDGLRWSFLPDPDHKGLFPSGDVLQFYHDPYQKRYYAFWKKATRRGRAAGLAVSRDGLKWTKPLTEAVMAADDLDPDDTQIYGISAFPYQGLYVGLPWIYHARWFKYGSYTDKKLFESEKDSPRTMDSQLAWSWNLVNWTRAPGRPAFIPLGKEGEFDAGIVIPAKEPVAVGDRLYFYYGGFLGHHADGAKFLLAATGLATLRMDGFCSMRAGAEEGSLISRRELFQVPRVTINAKTAPRGYVAAELLDASNQVIPGFSRKDCIPFTGDSVRHVLTWKTTELSETQRQTDKKIRFFLKNADLFSYFPNPAL
ncbi:MAG: hypothetical protein PHR77_15965 [Kiritimatiellae bacterium]|nr:hypothetical protein [Kiritimatiellia bacterium]MDD5523294.1 hypothetical protein [Kiritimatiellia bacterium]